jgi:hypothetical protein
MLESLTGKFSPARNDSNHAFDHRQIPDTGTALSSKLLA